MADSESGTTPTAQPLPRACDSCRSRKIRCDKVAPCGQCRTAGIACQTSERPQKEQRQRVLISNQYEQKIDAIENRLSGIERLLQRVVANQAVASHDQPLIDTPNHDTQEKLPRPSNYRLGVDGLESGNHFEGESSLSAHSKQAHMTLESLLGQNPNVRNDPEVATSLSALQRMMRKQGSSSRSLSRFVHMNTRSHRETDYKAVPPLSVTLDVLQLVKAHASPAGLAWFMFFDVDDFIDDCKKFYSGPSGCSIALKVNVYAGLHYIFSGHPMLVEHAESKSDPSGVSYRTYAERCRSNLEACLSNFPLSLEPSLENITALTSGALHSIQVAEFPLSWTLTCTAARLCQNLGWHRGAWLGQDGFKNATIKQALFWAVYYNDKCLSLRLGVSATFQDSDVALELPKLSPDPKIQAWEAWIRLTIELASCHGLTYDALYSPGASKKTIGDRANSADQLIRRLRILIYDADKLLHYAAFQVSYMRMVVEGYQVLINCMLTLVYRRMPAANSNPNQLAGFSSLCVEAARSTMQSHQRAIRTLQTEIESQELWSEYFNWTVLNCPFTPFMVVFSNVVTNLDRDDLTLLENFVSSLGGPAQGSSDAIIRFHQLCDGFYKFAKHYVAASLRHLKQKPLVPMVPQKRNADTMLSMDSHSSDMQGTGAVSDPNLFATGDDWLLSSSFEDWLSGDPQSLDFLNGDWPAFGPL